MTTHRPMLLLRWLAITFLVTLSNLRAATRSDLHYDDEAEEQQQRPTREATFSPKQW